MASHRNTFLFRHSVPFALLCQQALASPVPKIFPPTVDAFSIAELAQEAYLLELGFPQAIAAILLIFGCLTCLLVGALREVAAYLYRHDTKLWERDEEFHNFEDDEKEKDHEPAATQLTVVDDGQTSDLRSGAQIRVFFRYLLSNPVTPVTKINVYASPQRAAVITSPSGSSLKMRYVTSVSSPSKIPALALLKSAQRPIRFSSTKSFFFGTRPASSVSSSRKSVRWADQLHISAVPTMGMSVRIRQCAQAGDETAESEQDIATRRTGSMNVTGSADACGILPSHVYHIEPPAYEALSPTPAFTASSLSNAETNSSLVLTMQLEGDTS